MCLVFPRYLLRGVCLRREMFYCQYPHPQNPFIYIVSLAYMRSCLVCRCLNGVAFRGGGHDMRVLCAISDVFMLMIRAIHFISAEREWE